MPRSSLLLLVLLLALGGVIYLLQFGGGYPSDCDCEAPSGDTTGPDTPGTPPLLREDPAVELAGTGESGNSPGRRPEWPVVPSDQIPRGDLDVLPVDAEGKFLHPSKVTIRLEREGAEFFEPPVAVPDYETGVWRFEKLVIGWVRVIVFGDHIEESRTRANVEAKRRGEVKVTCKPGGMIRYAAKLYSGEAPEKIALKLLDPRTKRPRTVYWEVREPDAYTGVRRAAEVEMGPKGVVFGMPPGKWILHATSAEGEIDQPEVEVRPGETTEAEIRLRK